MKKVIRKKTIQKQMMALRRARRTRARMHGTPACPRLHVFRSAKHIYAQLIDDQNGKTLASASDYDIKDFSGKPVERAAEVGKLIAKKAIDLGVKKSVFDRGSYAFHGGVKALAEAAREGGLKF